MAALTISAWNQAARFVGAAQSRGYGQRYPSAALNQSIHSFKLAMRNRRMDGAVRIRSVIAQQIDERKLHATFARHAAGADQPECLVQCGSFHAGLENDLGDLHDIRRQSATSNRILRHKFQQRWIAKIVPAFEHDALLRQLRMLLEVGAQTCHLAGIEQLHSTAKCGIFNPLMMRQIQLAGERGPFNVPFQPGPTRESGLARNRKLRVCEAKVRSEDFVIGCPGEARMKFSDPLGHSGIAGSMSFQQVFGLILEVLEVGLRWKGCYRHGELPLLGPRSALTGRK